MLDIDTAIKHCLEVAEQKEHESFIDRWSDDDEWSESVKEKCRQCAADHRQLAEWLTELKQWRRVYGICPSYEMCIPECKEGYNAQIAEYKRLLKAAVEDMKFESQCRNCKYRQTGLDNICNGCRGNKYEWRYADETEKLLNDEKINNVE